MPSCGVTERVLRNPRVREQPRRSTKAGLFQTFEHLVAGLLRAELRAAAGLARLWCEQCRQGESRDLLAPVYGWFTEGFDTPDLKDAKALLDELT